MSKGKKTKKLDAPRAWGMVNSEGKLMWSAYPKQIQWSPWIEAVPVRILRESDYRKLLKEAKR